MKTMKKHKSKKKLNKVQRQPRAAKAPVIAASETEILELAPQPPLEIESEAQLTELDQQRSAA